jgi:hypothetical protein
MYASPICRVYPVEQTAFSVERIYALQIVLQKTAFHPQAVTSLFRKPPQSLGITGLDKKLCM